jgi:hypothetical protein
VTGIALSDILPIQHTDAYKIHFARWNKTGHPLDVFVRDRAAWRSWQEYRPFRNDFNRKFIFSLAQFYHETDIWLFGGIWEVMSMYPDRYEVHPREDTQRFVGRLKLHSPFRGRGARLNFEKHYHSLSVQEILKEPYTGTVFPGYDSIDISFSELEAIIKNHRPDWRAALENITGIYLITDILTRKKYVGAAFSDRGIWSRWRDYIESGHGGNAGLRELVPDQTLDYYRKNFRFSLLEHRSSQTAKATLDERESFWKNVLQTRRPQGLNHN